MPLRQRAGFDGVELFEPDLIACPLGPDAVRERMVELGLVLSLYQPFRDFEAVEPGVLARNLKRAERKLAVMQELGAPAMLVCSNVDPHSIDNDDLAARQLAQLADLAAGYGVRVAYEALAWGRHVAGFEHSWEIVERADHPNLGICLDSFHILARGDDPARIAAIPGERIFFVQLADAPRLGMDVLQWSRHHRCLPGQGGFDLPGFVAAVLAAGYEGPLSLEVFNDVLRQADARRTAVDAMRSMLALEDAVARRRLSSAASSPSSLAELPAPAALSRYAFVELAVDPVCGPAVQNLLEAIGLRHSGLHRSKPVDLWGNGDVRVVLNRDQDAPAQRVAGTAEISTFAVESTEPDHCAQRAELLLAPRLARRRGPREAELASIAAPDGVSVFMCQAGTRAARTWIDDFITPGPGFVPGRGCGPAPELTGIDHITLSQPLDYFDETLLFYVAVLGLEAQMTHELAAPHGLIRSRALRSPGGGVRIVLNVPLVGGGVLHPPEVQHVAFACRDIFTAAEAVRAHGVPVLPITDNYYDDLATRLDVADDLLARMRDLGICYDQDADGGEFLHFYTPLAGPRLFFEVVERRGGYDGYGAVNSVVRMSAQRGALATLDAA